MPVAVRLAWKQYRFEIVSMAIAIAVMIVAASFLTVRLNEIRPSPEQAVMCTEADNGLERSDCAEVAAWLSLRETELPILIGILPFVAAAVLGSVLVSREIEHRSAGLGWSLSGSRGRWLFERIAAVFVPLLVLLAALALAADLLEGARRPDLDPRASLNDYGLRGLPIVARGSAIFAGGAVIGAVVGRQLPALILTGLIAISIGFGFGWAFPYGVSPEWIAESDTRTPLGDTGDLRLRSGFQSADGEILTYREAIAQAPNQLDSGAADDWVYANFTALEEVLRGYRLTEIELREFLVLGTLFVSALGAAFVVVDRRRPY